VFASDDPGGKKIFGSWNLGADGTKAVFPLAATEAEMAGKLYTARLTLRNDSAATADLCPGYRVEYANAAFTHFGGVEVTTTDAAHAPNQGADYTISVAWEAPFGCLDMDDSGTLADWPLAAGPEDRDRRRYTLLFDLFHSQLADHGVFTLEEIVVQPIDLPTSSESSTVYTNYPDWLKAVIPGDYFQEGTMAQTASSITIETGSYNPQRHARFVGAFAPVASAVGVLNGNPACRSGKLVRLSIQAASVDVETTPMTRLFLHAYMSKTEGTYGQPDFQMTRNTVWFDIYGALEPFAKFITAWGGRTVIDLNQPNPGVPPEGAGTRLSTWAYSHEGYDEVNDYFLPDVQVLSLNAYADGASGWADDSGGVTFSDARIEIYP
jgi:hypothetical protein